MRRTLVGTVLAIVMVVPMSAGASGAGDDAPSAGGLASDNVEFVAHVPYAIDGVGGRKVGKFFYVNDQNKLMIFSTATPENPELVGFLPMPQEWLFGREDIDTNGKILILPNLGSLHIVDVEDKSNPTIIASLSGAGQHTNSCVLNCQWAYGSSGNIVDLRNPAKPKLLKEKWSDGKPASGGHDITEVSPGIVVTSTQPMMVLDARKNPARPKLLAVGRNSDGRFIHSNLWPRGGKDRFILAGGETNFQTRCNDGSAAFMTWDTRNWRRTRKFQMVDDYRMVNGTYADGSPPANVSCSSHWLEAHPDFRNGGMAAAAFYEHGTRLIRVLPTGKIKEVGWFLPFGGSTGSVYWITKRILYAVDYNRGMDIIRYTGKL